ncbi:MAG: 2-dehydropantoate 2-reductase [Vulcanimicrobiaceae bacterium]
MSAMNVAIVGAGALGTLVAAALAAECDVRMLVRDPLAERTIAARGGVNVVGDAIRAVGVTRDPRALRDVALVIVAVKTYATVDALAPLRGVLRSDAAVLSLQNGIDAAAHVQRALGRRSRIALGPTTEAATWLEPGCVRRAARGRTYIGWAAGHDPGAAPDAFAALFTRCGLDASVARPIEPFAWAKLVVNAAINPASALAGVCNGALLERPELRVRAAALAREAYAVAQAEHIALPFTDAVAEAERVMALTAANRSSMLQDLERGRPTEIASISGAIVRRAARHRIAVPETARAYAEIRSRERA